MKIVCNKDELLKGMGLIANAVSQKSTLAILSNILFEAKDTELMLAATDLEAAMKTTVKAQILKEGGITLPAKLIVDITRRMPQDEIEITADEQSKVLVKSGKTKYSIVGLPKTDFPVAVDFEGGKKFSIPTSLLKEMILKTRFAISTDETRYVLNGVYLVVEKGSAKMVATDGKRLAYIFHDNIVDKKISVSAIIPTKAIDELLKVISAIDVSDIEIGLFDGQIGFKIDSTVLKSRLIDGHFPNYDQVIPKDKKGSFRAKTQDLLNATDRVSVLASKNSSIKYSLAKGKLMLHAMEQGKGEGDDEIEVEYKGDAFDVAYNPQYIIDMLKVVGTAETVFEFSTNMNPGVLKPAGSDNYIYVIMPMRME